MSQRAYTDPGLWLVYEFHTSFGIETPDKPKLPRETPSARLILKEYHSIARGLGAILQEASRKLGGSLSLIRLQLIQEELAELAEALLNTDEVGVLDALVDLSYVVDGTYLTFGMGQLKLPALKEVHESNMSKLGDNGKPVLCESGRVLKGPRYKKPNLFQFF